MATIADYDSFVTHGDYPEDKIVQQGTFSEGTHVTIVNTGQSSGSAVNFAQYNISTGSVTNEYGKPVFVRYRWSVDGGTSWQGARAMFPLTCTIPGPQVTNFMDKEVTVGSDADNIYFRTGNNGHDGQTWNGSAWSGSPASATFLIEYWCYELD